LLIASDEVLINLIAYAYFFALLQLGCPEYFQGKLTVTHGRHSVELSGGVISVGRLMLEKPLRQDILALPHLISKESVTDVEMVTAEFCSICTSSWMLVFSFSVIVVFRRCLAGTGG